MFGGAVALVPRQPIPRKGRIKLHHHPVPMHLGQHARRRNRIARRVSLDDRLLRAVPLNGVAPVDEQKVRQRQIRSLRQHLHRPPHRFQRGPPDVDPVDGLRIHRRNRPRNRAGANLHVQLVALLF